MEIDCGKTGRELRNSIEEIRERMYGIGIKAAILAMKRGDMEKDVKRWKKTFNSSHLDHRVNSITKQIMKVYKNDMEEIHDDPFVHKIDEFLEQCEDEVPNIYFNVDLGVYGSLKNGIERVAKPFVIANAEQYSFAPSKRSKRHGRIPNILFKVNQSIEVLKGYGVPIYYDKRYVDLSDNNIKNMCRLKDLTMSGFKLDGNPIEKIAFSDEKQFLGVVYRNRFDDSNLPEDIKGGLSKCHDQLLVIDKLIEKNLFSEKAKRLDNILDLSDDDVKTYFSYADTCKPTYEKIQSSGMCKD